MKRNTHTFTIKHGDWSAVIETHSDHSLYELAETIIRAAKFMFDHAFGFYEPDFFKPRRGQRVDRSIFEQYTLFADMEGCDAEDHDPGVQFTPVGDVFEVGEPYIFSSITAMIGVSNSSAPASPWGRSSRKKTPCSAAQEHHPCSILVWRTNLCEELKSSVPEHHSL